MVFAKTVCIYNRKKLDPYLPSYAKNQLKMDRRHKLKTWDHEVAEENIGETRQYTGVGDDILDKITGNKSKTRQKEPCIS